MKPVKTWAIVEKGRLVKDTNGDPFIGCKRNLKAFVTLDDNLGRPGLTIEKVTITMGWPEKAETPVSQVIDTKKETK